jgi:hypothetical protein
MTPSEECKKAITAEYFKCLKEQVQHKHMCILIKNRCQDAAKHNGMIGYWREYIPEGLIHELY